MCLTPAMVQSINSLNSSLHLLVIPSRTLFSRYYTAMWNKNNYKEMF